eukprot:1139626-Pelagomonas_calceolata.AAC.5
MAGGSMKRQAQYLCIAVCGSVWQCMAKGSLKRQAKRLGMAEERSNPFQGTNMDNVDLKTNNISGLIKPVLAN